MKCEQAQQLIQDYLDELLDSGQAEKLAAHYRNCNDCAKKLTQERQFRQLLKGAPVPPPSAGFVDRALRQAVHSVEKHHHVSHRQGFIKGFGSALVAGVALWAVVSLFPTDQASLSNGGENSISISLHESRDVKLAFFTEKAVQGATIKISLSDNIEIAGYQNRQTLEWKTDLLKGDNVLTLPIKGLQPRQGKIIAQISHKNLVKSIELKLNVKKELDVKEGTKVKKPGFSNNNIIIKTPVA